MATVGTGKMTLADFARRRDPNGTAADIIEVMTEGNPIMQDAVYTEGNLPTGHKSTRRTSLPTGTYRRVNEGVDSHVSTTAQTTDTVGMLEDYAECDAFLAEISGNINAYRWQEDKAFIEGLGQTTAATTFYGNTATDPEKFLGLSPRYNAIGRYCIAGGSADTDNRSMWLVTWGTDTTHMIFPKGSNGGVESTDKGKLTLLDANSKKFEGYQTHFKQYTGLVLRDYRYTVRCCNIEHSALVAGTDPKLLRFLIQMLDAVPDGRGRQVIYCPRSVRTWLDIHREEKSNLALSIMDWAGEPTLAVWGRPIRICDALEGDEALVS